VIRRICLLSKDKEPITTEYLPEELRPVPKELAIPAIGSEANLKNVTRQAEYQKILDVLQQVRFNKSQAARLMNIDRKTLYNKLHTLNILL
jgi:two-component system response regulator HydG